MKVSRLSRNVLFLIGSNFATQFMRFLTIALLARRIGSEFFGVYNYLILLVTYGATTVEFGLKNLAIREFSQGRGDLGLIRKIVRIRAILAGGAGIVVMILAYRAFPGGEFLVPSAIFAATLFANAFLMDFLVVVEEKFAAQAAATVVQATFVFVGVLAFVHVSADFGKLALLFLGGQCLWAGILFFASRVWKVPTLPLTTSTTGLWTTALQGLPFLIALLFFTVQTSMDLLLLGQFHQREILGDYSAALKIISIPQGLIGAFVMAMQPRIAREAIDFASPKLSRLLHQSTRVLWLVLVPTVLGCWFFGDTLVVWVFGTKFPIAHEFLRPLSLSFFFSCLAIAPIQALTTSSKTRLLMKIVLGNALFTGAAISTVLYFGKIMLVPWTMVGAQFVLMISCWACFPEKTYIVSEDVRNLAVPAVLMATPLVLGAAHLPAALVFALAVVGYVGGLVLTRIWRRPWMEAIVRG